MRWLGKVSGPQLGQILRGLRWLADSITPVLSLAALRWACRGIVTSARFHVPSSEQRACALVCRDKADCCKHYAECSMVKEALVILAPKLFSAGDLHPTHNVWMVRPAHSFGMDWKHVAIFCGAISDAMAHVQPSARWGGTSS